MPITLDNNKADRIAAEFASVTSGLSFIYSRAFPDGDAGMFEPRRIVPPGGYHSPKLIAASLYTVLGENSLKMRAEEFIAPTAITAQVIAYEVTNHAVPIYCVAESLARAVAATQLPPGIKIDELNWPMSAMVVGFPRQFMYDYLGFDACYVFSSRLQAGLHRSRHLSFAPTIEIPEEKVAWSWFTWGQRGLESFVSSYWCRDEIDSTLSKYDYTDYTDATADVVHQNKEATEKVSTLMLKLLCVLNWRDNLIEPARCIRAFRRSKGVDRVELWSANIIGGRYRPRREASAPTGSHSAPRMHWRRGHSTYQVMGTRSDLVSVTSLPHDSSGNIAWATVDEDTRQRFWRSHRRVWIDPILVAGSDSGA